MKLISLFAALIALVAVSLAPAQTSTVNVPSAKTLAATMNIYVFPAQSQTPERPISLTANRSAARPNLAPKAGRW